MARRLVEAGVRCVTIDHTNWDTHDNNFATLRRDLLPALDAALATLFADLADRAILDKTLVVVTGEFGRTPRIGGGGRDHWAPINNALLIGGGLRMGQVIGESDSRGGHPRSRPISPGDLFATMLHAVGIDPRVQFPHPSGRPVYLIEEGQPIEEVI